jgi:methylase of polypeptide subunit release factors
LRVARGPIGAYSLARMTQESTQTPRTAGEMVAMARAFLERKGVESARLESELLVAHALAITRLELFMQLDRPLAPAEVDRARDLLVRRGRREPAAFGYQRVHSTYQQTQVIEEF